MNYRFRRREKEKFPYLEESLSYLLVRAVGNLLVCRKVDATGATFVRRTSIF